MVRVVFYSTGAMKKSHLNTLVLRAHFYGHGQWNIPIRFPWIHLKIPKWIKTFSFLFVLWEIVFFPLFVLLFYVYVKSVSINTKFRSNVGGTFSNSKFTKQLTGELYLFKRKPLQQLQIDDNNNNNNSDNVNNKNKMYFSREREREREKNIYKSP